MCAALRAPAGTSVIVIDKGAARAGSSPLAQGGIAAAVGEGDSPEQHAADTVGAGAGLCDVDVVGDVCAQGPAAIEWLLSLGCAFDRRGDGALHLAREGGQSVARSVHRTDATGAEIVRALRAALAERGVERRETSARHLLLDPDGRCVGAEADDGAVIARATLLATGGAGALWGHTTNAPGATGDGLALAVEAGAQLADLEFMQFHPTALDDGRPLRILLTEALRGAGATLVDVAGERFVDELAPRHEVARAIIALGGAFLDARGIERLAERFPTVVAGARSRGFDPTRDVLPVSPAAHYFIGGVAADPFGRTSVPGLFAAGECAATGMHGANRMAGNSLLETVVIGWRVGERAADEPRPSRGAPAGRPVGEPDPAVAAILWEGVGTIRDEDGLRAALVALERLPEAPHRDLVVMSARAARARLESRGVHQRSDLPEQDPDLATRSFDRRPLPVRD